MQPTNRCYVRSADFVFRAIAGETILVPIRREVEDLVAIYRLNPAGALAWEQMGGERAPADIAARLAAVFEVSPEKAARDLEAFVAELASVGAVTACEGAGAPPRGEPPRAARRQPYEPPTVTRVPLDARCAVLGFCKQSGTGAGPALPGCRDPLFSPCLSPGS